MNLSLTDIEVEAFKNFAAPCALQLDDLPPGLYRVAGRNLTNARLGSNGSGKTTYFSDAPTWCLFGRTVGGLRTTDVRSWLAKKPPRAALTLRADDDERVVQRGPRATDLTIDGRAVGQEDVEALVGLDLAAWSQAVVWGQGRPLFLDLAPRDKMALLSDALGLERWERRAEAASGRAKRLEAALAALDGELRGLETARDHAETALAEARAAAETWGREHAERMENLQEVVKICQEKATAAEDERGKADLAAESVGLKLAEARAAIDGVLAELRSREDAAHAAERALERLSAEEDALDEQLAGFEEQRCPTCGQPVKKRDADKRVAELRKQLDEVRASVRLNQKLRKEAADAAAVLQDDAEAADTELAELQKKDRERHAALLTLERRAAETRAEANAADADLRVAEAEKNPHRDAAAAARKRLKEIDAELKEGDTKAEKYEASVERAKFWAKGFRDIRLAVVDDVLDDLRETTAAVLEDLGLGEWDVDYATEHETKSGTTTRALAATVRAPGAPEGVRWEVYSGGEGQRLRLASALALGEVLLAHAGVRCDFRVLDEPTRGLSREGVRDLTEALADYAEAAGIRLFYVDHHGGDGLAFAGTITVIADDGGAHILRE